MQVKSTLARQGLGAALFALALLLIPLHATLGDTPDPRYLEADEQQILIEDDVSLLVLPDRDYGQLEIILQDENARIAELSLALAANAHFSLPEHDYDYRFNANTGRVEIFNRTGQRVLALPVDAQGLTPWVRAGKREETRIEVDPVTLALIEETLPNEQPLVTVGEAPEQVELVEASSIAPGEIALSWLATIDNDTPTSQIRYLLHAATDSGFVPDGSTEYAEYVGATSGTITGLLPETRYYLKVEAVDAAGHRSWSNELSAVTARVAPLETSAPRVVLDTSNTRDLTITADSLSYRLPDGANLPEVGDLVISRLDGGFLRYVDNIEQSGDRITLRTSAADLSEVFQNLQFANEVKLIDVPAPASLGKVAASSQLRSSATADSHSLHWPERGLTISQRQLPSTLGPRAASASTRSSTSCAGTAPASVHKDDAPLNVWFPEAVCIEPGNSGRIAIQVEIDHDKRADFEIEQLLFKKLDHRAVDKWHANYGATWEQPARDSDTEGVGILYWRPEERHIDDDGRPFTAHFVAKAKERKGHCTGLLGIKCIDQLTIIRTLSLRILSIRELEE